MTHDLRGTHERERDRVDDGWIRVELDSMSA